MRLFYAIEFDAKTRELLTEMLSKLKSKAVKANFTRSENLHLTLRFMGEVEDAYLPVLKKIQDASAAEFQAFRLKISNPGIFEKGHKSIVWWGVERNETLFRLQKRLEDEIRLNGFAADIKPYRPHITLAREFVSGGDIKNIITGLPQLNHTFAVGSISLLESTRENGKLSYPCRYRTPLLPGAHSERRTL